MIKYSAFLVVFGLMACNENAEIKEKHSNSIKEIEQNIEISPKQTPETVEVNYNAKTIFSPEIGWGYQILKDSALFINQPHIPSIQGNKGFTNEQDAKTTAEFIIYKLKNNVFPPTISPDELDSLGVL